MVRSRQRKSGANFNEERLDCRMTCATWFLGKSRSLRGNRKPECRAIDLEKNPIPAGVGGVAHCRETRADVVARKLLSVRARAWRVDVDPGSTRSQSCAEQSRGRFWRSIHAARTRTNRA